MKSIYILVIIFLFSNDLYAQVEKPIPSKADTIIPSKGNRDVQLDSIKKRKVTLHSDSINNQPVKSRLVDTTVRNKYGDLLNDDTAYNKRYSIWKPAIEVLGTNIIILSVDRFVFKYPYSTSVSFNSWSHNLKTGWAWDNDRFGINFSAHPYTGSFYFNAARSSGYSYFTSIPFALEGSLMWEYFGENTLPSYTDLVNTTVNGAFLGEILYRVSSNILDDRTHGINRASREILAGLVDPMRGFNRLLQGKTFRKTNKEIYAKEPLNVTLYGGRHSFNDNPSFFGKGTNNVFFNIQLDYGNPFEVRKRKPFDFFKLRTELAFGAGRKILDDVQGYGILFGKNAQVGKLALLFGGFQYYDYLDSKTLELMTIGLGGGVFSKMPFTKEINLYTNIHFAAVPLGANSGPRGPDTTQYRDYTYDDGLEGKFESTLNLGKYLTTSFIYYYYFIHTHPKLQTKDYGPNYNDIPGNNTIGVLKPTISLQIYKWLRIGFEHDVYYDKRDLTGHPVTHTAITEEKVFLLLYFEDKQRRGHYN